ncbi:MAG: hypothetical protein EOP08_03330 [Proteobacteria bacterium]|nr:MAG: hypothetical protein EOP08_03330 [Pseudomonadota bacterium]
MRLPFRPLVLLPALAGALLAACGSLPSEPFDDGPATITARNDGSGCQSMVARYLDRGTADSGKGETFDEVFGLDPDTVALVPVEERAVEVRHEAGEHYVLAVVKTTPPDIVDLFAVDAACEGDTLRFETRSRYESVDGVHVRRQQLRYTLIADADGTLVVRRQLRERALGLVDLKRGGDPLDTYRFARR